MAYDPVLPDGTIYVPLDPTWHDFLQIHRENWKPRFKAMLVDTGHTLENCYISLDGSELKRKSGTPIMGHLLGTAMMTWSMLPKDPEAIIAALLHDLWEDFRAKFSLRDIAKLTTKRIARMVEILTKDDPATYPSKILKGAQAYPAVLVIKNCDFAQNAATLYGFEPERRLQWCLDSQREYLPMFDEGLRFIPSAVRPCFCALLAQTTSVINQEIASLTAVPTTDKLKSLPAFST